MKEKVIKFSLVLYFGMLIPLLYIMISFSVLKNNPNIYAYIPQDVTQVVEVNTKNFIKIIGDQYFYNYNYFEKNILKQPITENTFNQKKINNVGIDITSKSILFSENWNNQTVWFALVSLVNKTDFEQFAKNNEWIKNYECTGEYVICQLSNITIDKSHIKNIVNLKVKSLDSKIDLSEKFDPKNEINIYTVSTKGSHFIDGFSKINFIDSIIEIEGKYSVVGKEIPIKTITSSNINTSYPFYFETTLNLLNDGKESEKHIKLIYSKTNILTSNNTIPINVQPELNLSVANYDKGFWDDIFMTLKGIKGVGIDTINNKIEYNKEINLSINYKTEDKLFMLFQESPIFKINKDKKETLKILDFNFNPDLLIETIDFKENKVNPPTMLASLKISVFDNVLQSVAQSNRIKNIKFNIAYSESKDSFVNYGKVVYKSEGVSSLIESFSLVFDLIKYSKMLPNQD